NCVLYKKQPTENPRMESGAPYKDKERGRTMGVMGDAISKKKAINNEGVRYPSSVQKFSNKNNGGVHPTQKPVALFEYLIKTYTNEGETVLDNCMGSGTTAIAAHNLQRNYIGFELDKNYYEMSIKRTKEHEAQTTIFDYL